MSHEFHTEEDRKAAREIVNMQQQTEAEKKIEELMRVDLGNGFESVIKMNYSALDVMTIAMEAMKWAVARITPPDVIAMTNNDFVSGYDMAVKEIISTRKEIGL